MDIAALLRSVEAACRGLRSQIDHDPYSPLAGCCDRRYWAWKLVDFPDATLQRFVQPLAWQFARRSFPAADQETLAGIIKRGLVYSRHIQHADGSFDQAFPGEHSFGATAFLLDSMVAAYDCIASSCDQPSRADIEQMLASAGAFLCAHDEQHGVIANHLAGAALALIRAGRRLNRRDFEERAAQLVARLVRMQSPEGWFPEYGGADPGYQTLALYYLAQVQQYQPSPELASALALAVEFVSHWIHPDGSYGGVYGSRRTAIYYAGGIALLARTNDMARRMTEVMLASIGDGRTVAVADVDVGNVAPVLVNLQLAIDSAPNCQSSSSRLPCEAGVSADFPAAGLFIRATARSWVIVGASNGGTVTAFNRASGCRVLDDGGYVGRDRSGAITTQVAPSKIEVDGRGKRIAISVRFRRMRHPLPTPLRFVLIRMLGAMIFRWQWPRERFKQALVSLLIRSARPVALQLSRTIDVDDDRVMVRDHITSERGAPRLASLACGKPFISIHMASAGYEVPGSVSGPPIHADVAALTRSGQCIVEYALDSNRRVTIGRDEAVVG